MTSGNLIATNKRTAVRNTFTLSAMLMRHLGRKRGYQLMALMTIIGVCAGLLAA